MYAEALAALKEHEGPEQPDVFLILCTDARGDDYCLWWGPNRCGYTNDFDRAGRYTREQWEEAVPRDRRHDNILVPLAAATRAAKTGPRAVRFHDLPTEVKARA